MTTARRRDGRLGQEGLRVAAGLLLVLLVAILARDIDRPYYGLHSWGQVHGSWLARAHLKYGLGYTRGLMTWAVGDPPPDNPRRYLDHPQLPVLLQAAEMAVLGVNDRAARLASIAQAALGLLALLAVLRLVLGDRPALLAALFFVLFPVTGYFLFDWLFPVTWLAIWFYLLALGEGGAERPPRPWHRWALAACLFLAPQLGWEGFFTAAGVGLHFLALCWRRRRRPAGSMLAVLIVAPFAGMLLNFAVMAAGYGWEVGKIADLFRWRAGRGEMPEFHWPAWFGRLFEFAFTNFTAPVLGLAALYLLYRAFGRLALRAAVGAEEAARLPRPFPHMALFWLPGVLQLLVLRGALWRHQTWERPLGPFLAACAALGVAVLADAAARRDRRLAMAVVGISVAAVTAAGAAGLMHYHSVRWQSPAALEMFRLLNREIAPHQALLSYESFVVDQHPSKGPFYRPEVAWYLDREIVQATTFEEVEELAASGRFPLYLVPQGGSGEHGELLARLAERYPVWRVVPWDLGPPESLGRVQYFVFDLRTGGGGGGPP